MNKALPFLHEFVRRFEELIAMGIAVMGYMAPVWLMIFQKKMRQMEMENEMEIQNN